MGGGGRGGEDREKKGECKTEKNEREICHAGDPLKMAALSYSEAPSTEEKSSLIFTEF